MESVLSSLRSIRRPTFLQNGTALPVANGGTSQQENDENDQKANGHALNAFNRLENAAATMNDDDDQSPIHLPALSFSDFGQWGLQPFNELFIRDRLRRRIQQNKAKYAKIGIVAQSVPLHVEIESIRDLLLCGGTVSEVRMSRNSQSLSVIVSYSKLEARAMTKTVSEMEDEELCGILVKYNHLRRTTLINQPCLLCGIYDSYFLQFLVSMIKKSDPQRIEQNLMRFITKSLIYCVVMDGIESLDMLRDTTLDLLNYEALHSLLMALNASFIPCAKCTAQHRLSPISSTNPSSNPSSPTSPSSPSSIEQQQQQSGHRLPREWLTKTLNVLFKHGLDRRKMIKNAALEHETAVMNPFNFQWIEVRQIIMIQLLYHPMATNPDDDRYGEFVVIWTRFYNELLVEWNTMKDAKRENGDDDDEQNEDQNQNRNQNEDRHQMECDQMALEIQLTVFESILKAVIGSSFLLQIIAFLALKAKDTESGDGIWTEYDLLIMLLLCGHLKGYRALLRRTKYGRNYNWSDGMSSSKGTLGAFEDMLSLSNVIPSNLKDIGRIIAVRSCCFVNYRNGQTQSQSEWMRQYAMQFVQCLKLLFYDHNLYDFNADERRRGSGSRERTNSLSQSHSMNGFDHQNDDKKEIESVVNGDDDGDGIGSVLSESDAEELDKIEFVGMISNGLKSHKKFLMECAFVDIEILRCLLELRLLDKEYVLERFRNTFDFIQFEQGVDAKKRWRILKKEVFAYNDNVLQFRTMKERELRMLFRAMVRVVVAQEFREWVVEFTENGGQSEEDIEKAIKIAKRGEIEDRYKINTKMMRLIQSYV